MDLFGRKPPQAPEPWQLTRARKLRRAADRKERRGWQTAANQLRQRAWDLEKDLSRLDRLQHHYPPRPQMWLETHPPQDQPNPTPSSSS